MFEIIAAAPEGATVVVIGAKAGAVVIMGAKEVVAPADALSVLTVPAEAFATRSVTGAASVEKLKAPLKRPTPAAAPAAINTYLVTVPALFIQPFAVVATSAI